MSVDDPNPVNVPPTLTILDRIIHIPMHQYAHLSPHAPVQRFHTSADKFDHRRRRVVHFKSLALPLRLQRRRWRIGGRVARHDLQVIRAIRHRRRVPGIKPLVQVILQKFPVVLVLATEIHREPQLVVIVVVRAPQYRLYPFCSVPCGCWSNLTGFVVVITTLLGLGLGPGGCFNVTLPGCPVIICCACARTPGSCIAIPSITGANIFRLMRR